MIDVDLQLGLFRIAMEGTNKRTMYAVLDNGDIVEYHACRQVDPNENKKSDPYGEYYKKDYFDYLGKGVIQNSFKDNNYGKYHFFKRSKKHPMNN